MAKIVKLDAAEASLMDTGREVVRDRRFALLDARSTLYSAALADL
ncbi:hypothetical protein [Streptomyces xinghaiensis]|nr:hypothetical protein [Streptomyces xinghaiensis]